MASPATRSPWAPPAAGEESRRQPGAPGRLARRAACSLGALAVAAAAWAAPPQPTLLVLGFQTDLDKKDWQERRLGMGIRGRLTQMCADSRAFTMVEEKDLAPALRDALGGYWLKEKSAAELRDLPRLHRETGADWIAYGALREVGVTRDRVQGLVGGQRWAYRVKVSFCLDGPQGQSLCQDGTGRSTTAAIGAVVEYRGNDVSWDQAGPAQAVDRALVDAFNQLMPRWERGR